uniref:Uncharacterized protein n=1 Tax=Nomascus leucogenys TaxID=61853 RepID=A0A2I3I046_NOMLE
MVNSRFFSVCSRRTTGVERRGTPLTEERALRNDCERVNELMTKIRCGGPTAQMAMPF